LEEDDTETRRLVDLPSSSYSDDNSVGMEANKRKAARKTSFAWVLGAFLFLIIVGVMGSRSGRRQQSSQETQTVGPVGEEGSMSAARPACLFTLLHQDVQHEGITLTTLHIEGSGRGWRSAHGVGVCVIPQGEEFHAHYRNQLGEETAMHAHGLKPPSGMVR